MEVNPIEGSPDYPSVGTFIHRPTMTSTNDIAAQTIRESSNDIAEPLLVYCDQQTAGRGQRGNRWASTQESLTFTWCVRESSISAQARPLLSLAAGVAVIEALNQLGYTGFTVKWPNDIVFVTHKVGGILVETIATRQRWTLIGIGINVNQSSSGVLDIDQPSAFAAASVSQATGRPLKKQQLMKAILNCLFRLLCEEENCNIIDKCNQLLAFREKSIRFQTPDKTIATGELVGINEQGHLLLDTENQIRSFFSGTIVELA